MKRTNSLTKRIVAALLGLALVLPSSLSFVGVGGTAEAATSLPNIQAIRSSGGVFEVMELVPAEGQGSLGYYVDGQEPCAGWKTEAAKMTVAERSAYVNALFTALDAASILSTGAGTPLKGVKVDGSNYYKEYYPWTKPQTVTNRINLITGTNDTRTEKQTIKGTAADGGANSGAYLSSGYILQSSKTGRYNQNITGFAQDQTAGSYYYNVAFSPLTVGQAVPNGTYLYYEAQAGETPSLKDVPISGGGTKNLVYQEIKGDYTVLEATRTYFSAAFDQPHANYDAGTAPFRAVSAGFTDVGTNSGWFKADVSKLQYLGDNEGNISFVANAGGADNCEITYDCVFYDGGYTNNNWFIKHVFDWEEGETKPSVIVNSYTPAKFDELANNLGLVGMVVISGGFNPSGTVTPYSAGNDISAATVAKLRDAVYDDPNIADDDCNLPIIFDSRVSTAAPQLTQLYDQLKTLTGLNAAPGVMRSVYFFGTTQFADNSSAQELITPAFNRYLPENTYRISGSLYLPVYKEITDENFTRQNTGSGVSPLEEKVTVARIIRYIINFAKQRNVAPKGAIRVLEVQPAKGSYFSTDAGKTTLQSWTGVALENIKIDTMTTAEFIGKIDDLAETYDLVYFGDDISGFSTSGGKTDFSDNSMDGLIYSNIGDTVIAGGDSGWNMSGLLDRDYDPEQTFTNEDTGNNNEYHSIETGTPTNYILGIPWGYNESNIARTFRYSGNDITPAKLKELSDFVSSGYPVIVADQLMESGRGIQYYNVQLNSSADYANSKVTLTPEVSGTFQNYTVKSCKWYRDGTLLEEITTGNLLAPKTVIADTTEHKYYCIVTVAEGGTAASPSTSNTIVVKSGISPSEPTGTEVSGTCPGEMQPFKVDISWSGNLTSCDFRATTRYSSGSFAGQEVVADNKDVKSIEYKYTRGNGNTGSDRERQGITGSIYWEVTVTDMGGNKYTARSDTYKVKSVVFANDEAYSDGGGYPSSYPIKASFGATISSPEIVNGDSVQLTTSLTGAPLTNMIYTWYAKNTVNGVTTTVTSSGSNEARKIYKVPAGKTEYYCVVSTPGNDQWLKAKTKSVFVTNEIATASTDLTSVTGAYVKITPPNQATVDNCSNMYALLNNVKDKTNLMTAANAETNKELLRRHMNLSKPKIEFVDFGANMPGKPKTYKDSGNPEDFRLVRVTKTGADGAQYNVYQLEYRFKITNSTDATPNETRYYCNLFVDTNADGRYRDSELLTGLKIYEQWNGNPVPSKQVNSGQLKAGITYYAECELPSDMAGIVPWQLEITKVSTGAGAAAVDNSHIHTSYHDYAYIKPEAAQTINILQVNTSRTSQSWFGLVTTNYDGINLQEQLQEVPSSSYRSDVTGKCYKGIYGKLFADVSRDFKVNITTIKANQLDGMRTRTIVDDNGVPQTVTYNSLKEYLDSYNMLVLGFDDCYQELSAASASEVVGYIDTGKAVLFTHDTTSFFFLPSRTYQTDRGLWDSIISTSPYMKYIYGKPGLLNSLNDWLNSKYTSFGYNFNMRIRDAVGLDRYGVTNSTYGITQYAPAAFRGANWNGVVAKNNNLSDQQKIDLTSLSYSIAYKPKSGTRNAATGEITGKATVPETQGLSSWLMMRYYVSGGKATKDGKTGSFSDYTTTQVTQVNEGQITTYPFNVNTAKFGGTSDYMTIAPTHFQYQQLNMNNDDVVVWYTLSGGEFDKSPRDVTNSYYIYSRGNVTYSGAGHTTDAASVNANVSEAKLFVNTMIASFRVAQTKPSVRFTDTQGSATVSSAVIPADGSTSLVTKVSGAVTDSSRIVCFTIKDSNIGSKTITAKFGVGKNADGTPIAPTTALDVYEKRAAGGDIKNTAGLVPGVVYYVKLDDIIKAFGSSLGDAPVELNMQISCKLKGAVQDKTLLSDIVPLKLYRIRLFDLG